MTTTGECVGPDLQPDMRRVFDSIDSGVLWYDMELRIVDANRAARRALDLGDGVVGAHADALGWRQYDEHGDPLPFESRPVWRARNAPGEEASGVVVIDTPRNGQRWLRVNAVSVESLWPGRGAGIFVSFTDFTEEREAMRALVEKEQLFRMFGDHSLDLMWIVDPRQKKLLYVNAAYERLWGRPSAPLYEDLSHWLDGVDPADRERVAGAALSLTPSGTYETEYRMHRPDGRIVWIRGRGFPLYGPDGRMRYMAGFAEDVTQARAAEALQDAHRRAQERLARIVATAPGAVHSYRQRPDGHGEFVFASPAIADLLGVDAVTLVDEHVDLLDIVHPEDRGLLSESLRRSATYGNAWLATFRVPGLPDGTRCIEAHSMPTHEADGGVVWHGFFIDVTERRRAEERIRLLNVELEQRVAERTAELEAKHREMESFTYSVSHDLKAPLRGIDGYSKLLETDLGATLPGEGRYFVSMIRRATAQMGELIDDLLAYSRVERGRPALAPIAAAPLVEAVRASVATEAAAADIALSLDVDPALRVVGERDGILLALRNLVDNAIKFSKGQPRRAIEIGVRRDDRGGLFWVRDGGSGFDMKYHDRIFEIFQRLHRAEDYPGTGVGLAIVRKAVERMNGRVWARSAPGEGAVFYLELPLADQDIPLA